MAVLIPLIPVIYIILRLVIFLPGGWLPKLAAAVFVVLLGSKNHLFHFFFGGLASPEMPRLVQIGIDWLYAALVFLFVLLVIKDVVAILLWLSRCLGSGLHLPFSPLQWAAGLILFVLVLTGYGLGQGVGLPSVHSTEVILPRLPAELDGLTLVQLTDMHASVLLPEPRTRAIVDMVNALEPDLILITGDTADGSPTLRANDVAPLGHLNARYGIFSCPGNHEYYSGFTDWTSALTDLGIHVLINSHAVIEVQGEQIVIAGVADPAAARFNLPGPDAQASLAGSPPDALRVLLAHQPRHAMENAAKGVDLQLSGHTHGGQITLINPLVAKANNGFVSGWYPIGGMQLYVSRGTGLWNGFPVRLGVPDEITKIVLRAQ